MATRKLTVLQVLPALESGGVEKGTLEVAQALVQKGHRSLVMSAGGRLVAQLVAEGSEHFKWPIGVKSLKTLLLASSLRQFLIDEKIDIVHVRSRLPAWVVFLAWRKMPRSTRPKLVSTVHGFYSVSWYSAIMAKAEMVIAVSDSVRQYVVDNYPQTDLSRLCVIHRGINRNDYPYGYRPDAGWLQAWYEQYPGLEGKKVITLPGRITRLKGHEDFITVIKRLVEDGIPVVGLIAGGVDPKKKAYFDELQAMVKQQGLSNEIIFSGHRSDLKQVMAVSDIVVSLTKQPESFGRTTLEALSMGVPVCGYSHGGVKEQLDLILPEGNIELNNIGQVVERIKAWIVAPPEVKVQHPFLLENMLNDTLNVYQQLVS